MGMFENIVKGLAPAIGSALGGPLAGTAIKFIAEKLLGNSEATQNDIEKYIESASPDQLLELKKLNAEFETRMKELEVDVFKLETQDKHSAREMAKLNMWPQIILSALFIFGYFIVVVALASGMIEIADAIKDVMILLVGVLTREVPTIMQFWFGSSFGSKVKDNKSN